MKKARAVGIQYAALPYRLGERRPEILLITSRETRRWVIPKGWPIKGLKPADAAAREASEEAGIVGDVEPESIGSYRYLKRLKDGETIPIQVIVFPLKVQGLDEAFKELGQRQSDWFPYVRAASLVAEPSLKRIIRDFGQARSSGLLPATVRFGRWIDAALFGRPR